MESVSEGRAGPRPLASAGRIPWRTRATLLVWAAAALPASIAALAVHMTPLTPPRADSARALAAWTEIAAGNQRPSSAAGWRALHVLSSGCACSVRVADRLIARGAGGGLPAEDAAAEAVLLLRKESGALEPELNQKLAQLRAAGFLVATWPLAEAERRLHISAVPVLLVLDAADTLRYAGGYTRTPGSQRILDGELLAQAHGGRVPAALPVFGCAITAKEQRAVDPLGLKYR